jgi:ectoine hydroxylase-related dioxygenase (phytanoyl-CoA dioxygenase family)
MEEFIVTNDLLKDRGALREQADKEGYLFFRGLLSKVEILRTRKQILALCREAGWLSENDLPDEGIAAPGKACVEPEPAFMAVYNKVMKLETFHSLAHDPALLAMFSALLDEQPLVHARNITRIIFPQNTKFTTPAHQDYVHIQGTPETWTAWIPLGDCPRDLGALAVMPGSHKSGIFPVHSAYGAGGLGIDTDALPYGWATTDFKVGDVVIFHSHTIHKALPNLSPERIRLSADFRYQGVSRPVTESCFQPHHAQVGWEEVYAGWKSQQYQYYWRDLPLNFAMWTPEYHAAAKKTS